jgi:hypothetical protein
MYHVNDGVDENFSGSYIGLNFFRSGVIDVYLIAL